MRVKKLNIINFKNHSQREFSFTKKINCFVGKNGVGKTNVLDALYYLSFSKSFINSADNQNIKNGEEFFSLRGVYEVNEMEENILLSFDKNKGKTLKRND
ncbi:MAG: AAA family ATPase, partial [Bacteroidales bacterium]|nr:AAA family ATPase [Bacteroidales bacterium]